MSVKERSFEIWGDEKFLESKGGKSILTFNMIDNEYLNFYYAPEPFFCIEIKKKKKDSVLLIIENKDTWYSVGRALNSSGACHHLSLSPLELLPVLILMFRVF